MTAPIFAALQSPWSFVADVDTRLETHSEPAHWKRPEAPICAGRWSLCCCSYVALLLLPWVTLAPAPGRRSGQWRRVHLRRRSRLGL